MKKRIITALCTFLFCHALITAQAQTDSTTENKKPHLKLSVNYNSNLNYFGRTDSLKSTGFFPMAEFWITPNFYINAAPIFVNNKVASFQYAGTVTTVGYQKMTTKWLSNIYVVKPFYQQNSQLVQSALKAQSGFSVSRLNKVLNVTAGADVKFSSQTDFGATAGLDHIIRIENKDNSVLVFDPSFYLYAGTQQYSKTYTKTKKATLLQPATQQYFSQQVTQFNVLAYELSMPIIYAKKAWQVIVTPAYIMPQHLLQIPNRPDLSEQGKNMLYTTATLKYTF